jgi:coenzyme F420 biosynthesis associated uncharacterized protein
MSPAPSPIDWDRAERVATRIAAHRPAPSFAITGEPHAAPAEIEDRIEDVTRLRSAGGTATVQLIDRPTWIRANIASFRTLFAPLIEQWQHTATSSSSFTRAVAGAQVGALLGWMSTRVLGQYDVLFGAEAADDGAVYLVGPNLASLEQRFGFDPHEFRTWVLVHELTHRAQFTGVPWMRAHFAGLVQDGLTITDTDPTAMLEALRTALRERRAAGQQVRDSGVVGLLAGPEQKAVMARVSGLMSLLEGHGDVTMTRAAGPLVPHAERFERVLRERRKAANPVNRLVMRLVGIEAKLEQYAAGERFITAIEARRGDRAVDRCWERVENLPTLTEIRAPQEWLARTEHKVA